MFAARSRRLVVAALLLAVAGCGAPLAHARVDAAEPVFPRERESAARVARARCDDGFGVLFPGLGEICQRRDEEGILLASVGIADAAATVAAFSQEQPAAERVSVTVLQDVWAYGVIDPILEVQRAHRALYVPQDTLTELAAAPLNGRVLARPEVSIGVVVVAVIGFGLSAMVARPGPGHPGAHPLVFGQPVAPGFAHALAGATFGAEFTQVAIAEEVLFRGYLQSSLAAGCGESCGWAVGGYLFGGAHALNVLSIDDPAERRRYLALAVPYLVLVGQYVGGIYRMNRYSLAVPVAMHFWYDVLLSAADFVYDPRRSAISMSIAVPF